MGYRSDSIAVSCNMGPLSLAVLEKSWKITQNYNSAHPGAVLRVSFQDFRNLFVIFLPQFCGVSSLEIDSPPKRTNGTLGPKNPIWRLSYVLWHLGHTIVQCYLCSDWPNFRHKWRLCREQKTPKEETDPISPGHSPLYPPPFPSLGGRGRVFGLYIVGKLGSQDLGQNIVFLPQPGKRAEYCFESTDSEERTHWVLRQTRVSSAEKLGVSSHCCVIAFRRYHRGTTNRHQRHTIITQMIPRLLK